MPRLLQSLAIATALMVVPQHVLAQETEDPPSSEKMPLAAESLLMDLVQMESGRIVAVGERGHVVYSEDGETWTQADYVPTRSTLTSISTAGDMLWAAGHDTIILVSDDAGVNWRIQNFDPDRLQPIMDIHFSDPQTGWVAGAYGLFFTTTDGGLTWEEQYVSEDEWHLNGILDLGDGKLVLAAEAGYSFRSNDGGFTWEAIEMPYPGSMFGISLEDSCILVFGLRGNVQESCDVGDTWEELESGTLNSLGGGVTRGNETVLVGNSGEVLVRRERGAFDSTIHSSGVDFSAVIALDDGFLLVGEEGVHHFPESAEGDAAP